VGIEPISIPKVVGSIPTVARHIFQACPVWIYTQSNITSIKYSNIFGKGTSAIIVHVYQQNRFDMYLQTANHMRGSACEPNQVWKWDSQSISPEALSSSRFSLLVSKPLQACYSKTTCRVKSICGTRVVVFDIVVAVYNCGNDT
jgi:hypothetical protein